jgi:hypothetical protein
LELMDLAKQHVGGHAQGYGMKALCGRYLELGVDKFGQGAVYSGDLEPKLVLDAKLSLELCVKLLPLRHSGLPLAPTDVLQAGEAVQLYFNRRVCAAGEMVFCGGEQGHQRQCTTYPSHNYYFQRQCWCLCEVVYLGVNGGDDCLFD